MNLFAETIARIVPLDTMAMQAACVWQMQFTKPAGSLGRMADRAS